MTGLNDIPVTIEAGTGNVVPLLHEVRHALQRVATGGEGTVIDLRSLPLAPGEEARIEEALGEGEIRADLDALGPTSIRETAYPGVWIVTHRNVENEIVARFIEVCSVPEILKAPPEDMENAVQGLTRRLDGSEQETV